MLISEKKIDSAASQKYGDLEFSTIPAVAKPSTFSPKMLPFLLKVWKTERSCRRLFKARGTDAVLGMGGFTSLPPVHAGHALKKPSFVHDSNALPGKANRITAKFCSKVLIGLDAAKQYFPSEKTEVVGTPVRKELRQLPSREAAAEKFGIDPNTPTILCMGGSQGARNLNTLVSEASDRLGEEVQVLHLAGGNDFERMQELIGSRKGYHLIKFCDDMAAAYAVSDIVVMRSGASSLTEVSAVGLPSILIPYPYAADDHQTVNAEVYVKGGAAEMAQESDLNADKLADMLRRILFEKYIHETMKVAIRELAVDDAASRICDVIEKECVK